MRAKRSHDRGTRGRGPRSRPPGLVFEDDAVLVVEKPAGLLTIATATEKRRTLYARLRETLRNRRPPERVFIVHRLDREVSGLLVFAKTPAAKQHLQRQFQRRSAGRTYLACVEGSYPRDEETLRSHLVEGATHPTRSTADTGRGRLAITRVRVVRRGRGTTLLEVRLETGRRQQIRAHLAERGHPVLGDRRYGSRQDPIGRLALHAAVLRFAHPASGEPLEFRSEPPPAFRPLLRSGGPFEPGPGSRTATAARRRRPSSGDR